MRGADAAELALVAHAGFERLESSRRKRLESHLARLVRTVSATGWIIGVFDSDRDLLAFEASGPGLEPRTALTLLYMVPAPPTGPVSLKIASPHHEKLPAAIGAAVALGAKNSLVLVLAGPQDSEQTWTEAAATIQHGVAQIAEELAHFASQAKGQRPDGSRGPQSFFLLTPRLDVELAWHPQDAASNALARLVQPQARRLPLFLERAVRRLTASWNFAQIGTCHAGVAYPIRGLSLRVVPMRGAEVFIGAFLDHYMDLRRIDAAASIFRISPREQEVLHALLDGRSIAEIAASLSLAESTVNDHIARMIAKTNSNNRIAMAATLLGWPSMKAQTPVAQAPADSPSTEPSATEESDANPRARCSWQYHVAANFPPPKPVH